MPTVTRALLVKIPFTKFSRAKGKDGILTNHTSNVYHQEASDRARAFINTYQNPQIKIEICIRVEARRLSNTYRHILSETVQTIVLLGRQALQEITEMTALQTL